ncbi:glycoside hydrolase family 99-like domain-containing protein [Allorhizobium terrae]|uniref:Methyltransferase domain-containing protein n=1 Tax=Allorhizobium terrae TaxID=1848972 RepID=A0A4S4A652_9HYPH|nr:glycoside hydrolase family 99-like domain-containing protein [Allorhizobium terrae]THF54002.1 methyltransferase domain-containing protein [Allorhizobium terrae]
MNKNGLKPDGERFLPEFSGTIEFEHYHRYLIALDLVKNKHVLDIASGEGFGSEILARHAKNVIGVDVSQDAVDHANEKYARDTLSFICGSATNIPIESKSVDVVISFETIEHLSDHALMISEIKRVLKPDGLFLISSPNKLVYSDQPKYKNPFHVRELYTSDFNTLVSRYFQNVKHFGQRVVTASVVVGTGQSSEFKTYTRAGSTPDLFGQMYDIILASDQSLPDTFHSIYEEPDSKLQPQKIEALLVEYNRLSDELRRLQEKEKNNAQAQSSEVQCDEQHQKLAEISAQKQNIEASLQSLELSHAKLLERLGQREAALEAIVNDANRVLADKWWRRTRSLRRWSNSIRKIKGKTKKYFPVEFNASDYLNDTDCSAQKDDVTPVSPTLTIPTVQYSSVKEDYVAYEAHPSINTSPKLIAFYLPQFHPFKENDIWWGKGFTEWTNVGKAKPLFEGHHQPHCPIHLGYYDLRLQEVMEEQARLAVSYGVSGFACYFYWFAGKVLMETPLKNMLNNDRVDIPFCMIWANENWTRRWDGAEHDVLIAQDHSLDDSRAMLEYLRPFLESPRYIKIDGKPLFIIYRADIIPDMAETLKLWRSQSIEYGFPGLYIVCAQTFGHKDPREFGFDAAMEFPPHTVQSTDIAHEKEKLEPEFFGSIFDYDQVVLNAVQAEAEEYKVFPTTMLSWDNTARKGKKSTIFSNFSLTRYSQWLSSNAERVSKNNIFSPEEKIMFVNAWNEWAEGTHLEPDQKHGFGYLAATRSVMENYESFGLAYQTPIYPSVAKSKYAIIIHLHYESTWKDLFEAVSRVSNLSPDIYVTVTSIHLADIVRRDLSDAVIELVDNRGRDIRPFLHVFRKIEALGYSAICKIHGKASTYRTDGDELRTNSLRALLTEHCMNKMISTNELGLLAPSASLIDHNDKNMLWNGHHTPLLIEELGLENWRGKFPAGSMFWFRPQALSPLLMISENRFDVERGLADGTISHAIERLFGSVCISQGFKIEGI